MTEQNKGKFFCPKCGVVANVATQMFIRYSVKRLELPVFLCSHCWLIYVDKPIIRQMISEWRKTGYSTKTMPFLMLYKEFCGEVEKQVNNFYIGQLGYKKRRFLKSPKKNSNPR